MVDRVIKGNKLKNFISKNCNTLIFLTLLIVLASLVTYFRILVQLQIGPVSDSFDFLSNALVFAGQGTGYADLLRPPLFSFIISLIFRIGYVSSSVVFIVDGLLFIFGVIGFYFLLKLRFSDVESFIGALLYVTFPIILTILSVGFSDLSSVTFTIWTFYFLILAVKKDSRFYYLVFPFAMFAFITRYNSAFIIFPIFLYLWMNKSKIDLKNILIGIFGGLIVFLPVLAFFNQKFGNMIYPFVNFESSATTVSVTTESAAYNPNLLFFIQKFPEFIGAQGITILLIIAIGVLFLLFLKIHKNENSRISRIKIHSIQDKLKFVFLVVVTFIFIGTFGKFHYMVSEVLLLIMLYLFYELTKNLNLKHLDLNFLFLSWFMVFFIFQSIYVIKDNRYFVLMAPAVAYFMILGLTEITNRIKLRINGRNLSFILISTILLVIMLFSTVSQLNDILNVNNNKVVANNEMIQASQWFVSYDPNYKNQNIYSDLSPNFSWYLKTNVKTVPVFKNNQTYPNGVKNYTFNQADSDQFNNFLVTNNVDYYLCVREGLNLSSYTPVKQFGIVTIYKKN